MATILEENRKHLRQALRVECGFQETSDEPTSITPSGDVTKFEPIANLDKELVTSTIMDLAGSGFLNNGEALPMKTDTDSFRYGYISADVAQSDGSFLTPFQVTITAGTSWKYVTLEVMGQYGETSSFYRAHMGRRLRYNNARFLDARRAGSYRRGLSRNGVGLGKRCVIIR